MRNRNHHISRHAALRMAQRNVSPDDASLVIRYGTVEYRTGAEFYFLAEHDIPLGRERDLERLVGTTVLVERGRIRTVYRNRRALHSIRCKPKRRLPTKLTITQESTLQIDSVAPPDGRGNQVLNGV